jgi:hypothetical protein
MRTTLLFFLIAGCAAQSPPDVTGPYTGPIRRYAVDSLVMPMDKMTFADDLDGDGVADNRLGGIYSALLFDDLAQLDAGDLIASGAIASFVEIQSDSPYNDPTVAVRFLGAEGAPAIEVGGQLSGGSFVSNRSRTSQVPGSAVVHLPLYADAAPLVAPLWGMEIDIDPGGTGLIATVRGVVRPEDAIAASYAPVLQTIAANLRFSSWLMQVFDVNRDGVISEAEFTDNATIKNLFSPDLEMFDAAGNYQPDPRNQTHNALSVGFQVHLIPCDSCGS